MRALASDATRLREDHAAVTGRQLGTHQSLVHHVWLAATTVFAGFGISALLEFDWVLPELFGAVAGISAAISLFGAGPAWRASVFGGFRQRFWGSRLGRLLYTLAGVGLRRREWADERDHQPTELVLGLAAEALFEALPRDVQRELADLPNIVRSLREDAQRVRRRCDALGEAIVAADAAGVGLWRETEGLTARRAAVVADLRSAQVHAQRQLAETVAALEAIRLDLLRLRVGAGTVESITADLAAARGLSEAAERLLAAGSEVEAMLPDAPEWGTE